jgi:hypothetical protein
MPKGGRITTFHSPEMTSMPPFALVSDARGALKHARHSAQRLRRNGPCEWVSGSETHQYNRWMMILQSVCDDSETQVRGRKRGHMPFFVLGGLVSSDDNWTKLDGEWQVELDKSSSLEYFKFSEALGMTKQFDQKNGWSEAERDRRLFAFARIANKYAMNGIFLSVNSDEYAEFVAGFVDRITELKNPYFFCFYQMIDAVTSIRNQHQAATGLEYIFDEHGEIGEMAIRWWPRLKAVAPWRNEKDVGSKPVPLNDKTFKPLRRICMQD